MNVGMRAVLTKASSLDDLGKGKVNILNILDFVDFALVTSSGYAVPLHSSSPQLLQQGSDKCPGMVFGRGQAPICARRGVRVSIPVSCACVTT